MAGKGGLLGDLLPAVLTIAGTAIGNPELGLLDLGLGATAGEALGAAAGDFAGNLITGQKPLKALENAGIAGATTGATMGLANNAGDIGSALFGTSPTPSVGSGAASIDTASLPNTPVPGTASAGIGSPAAGPISAAPTAPASAGASSSDILDTLKLSNTQQSPISAALQSTSVPSSGIAGASGAGSSGVAPTTGFTTPSTTSTPTGPDALPNTIPSTGSENSIAQAFSTGSGSDIINALGKNSNILIPGAGLAYNAIQGNQTPKGFDELSGQANQLATQGQQLQSYLASGTLPPGLQQSLDQASQSAKASIRSQYAARGMSGSSAEAQDLASVDQRTQAQGASLAMQLLGQGVQETQLSGAIYQNLMKEQMEQDQSLGSSIANFATAAAGGVPGGTFKIQAA